MAETGLPTTHNVVERAKNDGFLCTTASAAAISLHESAVCARNAETVLRYLLASMSMSAPFGPSGKLLEPEEEKSKESKDSRREKLVSAVVLEACLASAAILNKLLARSNNSARCSVLPSKPNAQVMSLPLSLRTPPGEVNSKRCSRVSRAPEQCCG